MNTRQRIFGDALSQSPLVTVKKPSGVKANMLHTIRVRREESRRADTRVGDRHRMVGERFGVTHDGALREAELINICGGGAMVAADFQPRPWDRVDLHLGETQPIACRVLWIRDGRIGLEFDPALPLNVRDDAQAAGVRDLVARQLPQERFEAGAEGEDAAREEQRMEYRNPLIRLGTIHYDYQSTPARLRDISAAGAMIETSVELVPGAEPLIDIGDAASVFGTVVWAAGGRAGLRFNEPFDWSVLLGPRSEAQRGWKPPHLHSETSSDLRWGRRAQEIMDTEFSEQDCDAPKH